MQTLVFLVNGISVYLCDLKVSPYITGGMPSEYAMSNYLEIEFH